MNDRERREIMKVAVVFFPAKDRRRLVETARGLVEGIEKQGHQVDLIDGERDVNVKLTIYQYIALGTDALSVWGGRISENIKFFLANSGIVTGKRSFAFVSKGGIIKTKTLRELMKVMEREGMYLKKSDFLLSAAEAVEVGKRLHIG
jgi:menaquinone-dependent protoporphyrinogen IX oxidase